MIPTHIFVPVFWTIFIVILSVLPSDNIKTFDLPYLDKAGHFLLYACWAFFVLFSFTKDHFSAKRLYRIYVGTFIAAIMIGVMMESIQKFMTTTRNFDFLDIVSNLLGALFGIIIFLSLKIKRI